MIMALDHILYQEQLRAGTAQPGDEMGLGSNPCAHLPEGKVQEGWDQVPFSFHRQEKRTN